MSLEMKAQVGARGGGGLVIQISRYSPSTVKTSGAQSITHDMF
jgi:hypothetical protein